MANDDIDHIPSIVPSRDRDYTVVKPTPGAKGGAGRRGKGRNGSPPSSGGGSGLLARLMITVALVGAGGACGWAWQLQGQLREADAAIADYASRIADLEDRLSDTDEGMSQNAAVQAAKIKELDSEVRKLWDNVWKKSKERLAKLEADSKSQGGKIAANEKAVASLQGKVKDAEADLAKLNNVAGDLGRLMSSAKSNQTEVERVADTLNRINLDLAKMNRRISGNEEAVRATDAFRRQVNASIAELESAMRILQAAP
jgi:chromosome segregation ATPase